MILLKYHRSEMFLPESFEECSGKQFIKLAALKFKGGDEISCQVKALKILCGFSAFRFALLNPYVINNALPFVDWVFETEKNLVKQLIPHYRRYHGPVSDFDNLKMNEFHMSELYFREITRSEGNVEDSLNNLIASIYRLPKKKYDKKRDPDGDIRVKFNHNEIPFHAKRIAKWPLAVKHAILLWYGGCRKALEENNPLVFKDEGSDFESQFDTGMYGIMRNLAGDKLGSIDAIEEMYVKTCMLEIGLIKEEEKYFEQKMKQKTA